MNGTCWPVLLRFGFDMRTLLFGLTLILLNLCAVLAAEEAPVPPADEDEEVIEPEVTIRQSGDKTIHEYRMNGRLYMVKIVPRSGPPYYLLDLDGDGEMDVTEGDPRKVVVPQWVLFRW